MERINDGSSSPPSYLPTLDGVRGIAIALVVAHQLNHLGGHDIATRIADHLLVGGWAGVQLFFVLSGFLITGILLDSRESPDYYRTFYIRRALRIFPIYYIALLLLVVLLPALGVVPPAWREHQLWLWLYLSNWTLPFVGPPLPHFWSLAVEEQFYLLWPLLVHSRPPRALLRLCGVLAVLSVIARVAMVAAEAPPLVIYMNSFSRLDALIAGAAVAALLRMPGWLPRLTRSVRPRVFLPVFALGAIAFEMAFAYHAMDPFGQVVGYSVMSAIFALVILAAACADAEGGRPGALSRFLASGPMRALGKYSYGMYIFHKPMSDLIGDPVLKSLGYAGGLSFGGQVVYLVVADSIIFVAGMLSYWLIERHFLALKRHFERGPRAQRESS